MTTVTMAGTGVEGWHSVSLSLVWFTGVAFTYDYCHNGRYWSGGVAFSVTVIGAVYRCGIYLWLHCRNGSYSTGDVALCVTNIGVVYRFTYGCTVKMVATASLTLVWFTGVVFTCGCTVDWRCSILCH